MGSATPRQGGWNARCSWDARCDWNARDPAWTQAATLYRFSPPPLATAPARRTLDAQTSTPTRPAAAQAARRRDLRGVAPRGRLALRAAPRASLAGLPAALGILPRRTRLGPRLASDVGGVVGLCFADERSRGVYFWCWDDPHTRTLTTHFKTKPRPMLCSALCALRSAWSRGRDAQLRCEAHCAVLEGR